MKSIFGYIFFFGGTAGALISAVSPEPLSIYFILSSLAGASGALVIRFTNKRGKSEMLHLKDDESKQRIVAINTELKDLLNRIASDPYQINDIKTDIENIQNHIIPFHNSEKHLIESIGLLKASDIISDFATGERFLGRAWSALVDGYTNEFQNSLTESSNYFNKALDNLLKLQ